jgi:hypothetical protein
MKMKSSSLYLVALGGEPARGKSPGNNAALALLAVLGNQPPAKVTIDEMEYPGAL